MKSHFFCDACNREVASHLDKCPYCGVKFAGVRCPACQYHGTIADFANGCPSCGYTLGEQFTPEKPTITKKPLRPSRALRYPWQLPTKDIGSIAVAFIIASIALLVFYYIHNH
ncbi:zinc ribbon domain-containing protein [Entomospira entomophila]|uniref:Zinc ribbon domain-containing protein n=1 Tax=Entomospira entomophila TaxID=2719988 RepID=A0A968KTB4_9SPIO|nr:zinc ribbon domain-containing protein [Entomospira entomophilus]NIZ40126.1 zinc ribbon domain-containing protein [Entomospira entomophilus]WDI35685.1 zinc ribbon domain-containing protein [Entomospira entomophilus]